MGNYKTICSISGGQSSAYIAANYKADYRVFSLVTIEDRRCTPKDKKLVQIVSDRIGKEFIATAEDDKILHTILDLEQFIGNKIEWLNLVSFDEVIKKKGGYLPNKMQRFCTVEMKLRAIFRYWKANINEPVKMQIGFRANEQRRAKNMLERANKNGLIEFKDIIGKHKSGKNKWQNIAWQKPIFPLIESNIYRDNITTYWQDKPVRFAPLNNCVGCFHRNPLLLKKMYLAHPNKMRWFEDQENNGAKWRSEITYKEINKHKPQIELNLEDFSTCDSGYCGV